MVWTSIIRHKGVKRILGWFHTEKEAYLAYVREKTKAGEAAKKSKSKVKIPSVVARKNEVTQPVKKPKVVVKTTRYRGEE